MSESVKILREIAKSYVEILREDFMRDGRKSFDKNLRARKYNMFYFDDKKIPLRIKPKGTKKLNLAFPVELNRREHNKKSKKSCACVASAAASAASGNSIAACAWMICD